MNAFRLSIKLLAAALISVLALTGALWLWGGTDSSLATLLTQFQRFLPADQVFEAKEVQGSLRNGGHIGWLRWRRGDLTVEAQDVGVAWTLRPLFNGQLRLSQLTVASLTVDDQRASASASARTPPVDLRLPITVDVPFTIASLTLTGATQLQASKLSGHYVFDSYSHKLDEGKGLISSGDYQFGGELQAVSPMALTLKISGVVQTTVPSSQKPLTVAATAQLTGSLAGPDATLAVQATLRPELPAGTGKVKPAAMQATLSARIQPWHAQPISEASGQWQALDLAALWPQAPQTLLTGEASVAPAGEGWQGKVNVANALPGPWNLQHLPLTSLRADVDHVQGQWALQSMQATGAGGTATGSGKFNAGLWQGSVQLQGVNPAAIDSRLAHTPMSGTASAQQTASGIGFTAKLQAMLGAVKSQKSPQRPNSLQALQLQSLQAQGDWAAPQLTLSALRIDAYDAQLQGKLGYNITTQATQGQLALTLPGLKGSLDGHLASNDGKGTMVVSVADAAPALRWLSRWPSLAATLQNASLQGAAELEASWQGGWRNLGHDLRVNASLRAPRLDWAPGAATKATPANLWQLRDLQADLSGTLSSLQFSSQGKATTGTRLADWQAQASAGQVSAGHWQGSLGQLKLSTQDSALPGLWTLTSGNTGSKTITLDWLQNNLTQTLTVGSGTAQLAGPMPGVAQISWEPARWSAQGTQTPARSTPKAQWQSQGHISNLPLAWLELLSGKNMADLGLSSDMILAGQWDAKHTDALHLSAMLERSSGDLRLRADNSRQLVLPAEMKEAQLRVNLDDGYLSSSLRWDSTRAGKALMAFSTRLKSVNAGWALAGDAAVGGGLQIQMPPVDAWSVLAPPGWRLRGTMNADVTLNGTLDVPQWNGTLQARDLAVRSVVDGIDFNQGTLNVRLHEQQLDIQDFTLQGAAGAAGASGGQLAMTGSVFWLVNSTQPNMLSRFRMALELQAKALRVSSRSDRRMVVSGKVSAQLKDARLTLRGALTADQAMIILPDDNAPQLGDDVVVRSAATKAAAKAQPKLVTSASTAPRITPDVYLELDLGPDFQVRGRGLEARLTGKLELQTIDGNPPTLVGSVHTDHGTYQAYGQRLSIEQGEVRFVGPPDNPVLDILAIRPKLTQRVGVQVLGTALSPVIRLYAEPDLPEAEKLAWLVMGRSAGGSGGETALLQQAALALLGSKGKGPSASLTQALGLDELSFRGNSGTATSATLTIGKRLSNDFYVAYESGLAGTMGVFTIFYDLSQRLTLRAQTGEQSAVDLIWTHRYD